VVNRKKKRRINTITIYAQSKKRRGTIEENDAKTKGWKITIKGCDTKDSVSYEMKQRWRWFMDDSYDNV
jgi:hypothetical protein